MNDSGAPAGARALAVCLGCGEQAELTYRDRAGFMLCAPCGEITEEMETDVGFISNPRFDIRRGEDTQAWMRRLRKERITDA